MAWPWMPRSDIFSFRAILYEMLSGKRAFHGDTPADTMSSILKEDPPDLSETNRNVSPALERMVQHCLEKNPEARLQGQRRLKLRGRVPGLVGLASGLGLALAMLGLGWWLGRTGNRAPLAEYQPITFRGFPETGQRQGADPRAGPVSHRREAQLNDLTAPASSSFTSKTVYSLVICSRSWTFLVRFSSLSSPP